MQNTYKAPFVCYSMQRLNLKMEIENVNGAKFLATRIVTYFHNDNPTIHFYKTNRQGAVTNRLFNLDKIDLMRLLN